MSSAARSSSASLSGPVAVCVDRPLLALDRPFTYELSADLDAGIGSLVKVRFHGKLVRGWVLGLTDDVPDRLLPVVERASPVPCFDGARLELFRWISRRYVAPLAAVIDRAVPPRVVSEESRAPSPPVPASQPSATDLPRAYRNGARMLRSAARERGTFVVRAAPGDDADVVVACASAALRAGRQAVVIVPEVDPVPATVRALEDAFGARLATFYGGDKRSRYRTWLEIGSGRYDVVVGTRPAVFAPLDRLGVIMVAREHHGLHREERSPYFHAREVAAERSRIEGAVCVLVSTMPSLAARAMPHTAVEPERRVWPPVEVVKPGPEGRAPRLVRALRSARCAFVYEPLRGYGVARVCRACGEPAACASCGGMLREEDRAVRCTVCESPGRCASCGASDFGIARGGAERTEEWLRGVAAAPVRRSVPGDRPAPPDAHEVVVGGIDAVKDFGRLGLDLVAISNADASLRRPGVSARESALGAWAELAAWTGPDGRVIVQTTQPNDHAVQALVTGNPERFGRIEAPRLAHAGFPVGAPVFRVAGTAELEDELRKLPHRSLLASALEGQTVCLAVLDPGQVGTFGEGIRTLAERGVVTRVEAEPHL